MTITEFLKSHLQKKGITQYRLSKLSGISERVISDVLRNNGAKTDTFISLCKALEISGSELETFVKEFEKKPTS